MIASHLTRMLCAAAIACLAFAQDAHAQTAAAQPSAAAVALAREVVEAKGALNMFDSVVIGVIEYHKSVLLQSNPNLAEGPERSRNQASSEFAPRRANVHTEIARAYASRFTEQELKEILAFYKIAARQEANRRRAQGSG